MRRLAVTRGEPDSDRRWHEEIGERISEIRSCMPDMTATEAEQCRVEMAGALSVALQHKQAIAVQVQNAKRAHASGEGTSDREWLRRAEYASAASGRLVLRIQETIGALKRHRMPLIGREMAAQRAEGEIDLARVRDCWVAMGIQLGELVRDEEGRLELTCAQLRAQLG